MIMVACGQPGPRGAPDGIHKRRATLTCLSWLAAGALMGCANMRGATPAPAVVSPEITPPAIDQTASVTTSTVPAEVQAPDAATPAAPAPTRQELQGQLSIKLQAMGKTPAKGLSLGFFFSGNPEAGQLDLITLMGSQLAQVNWTPDEVWLSDDKGKHRYESMAHLSTAVLGEALPLQALMHWMQGAPSPQWPSAPGTQPQSFTQLGWTIDQSEFAIKKLTATRAGTASQRGVFVKVYLDR